MAPVVTEHKYVQLDDQRVPIIVGTTMKVVELVTAQQTYCWTPEILHLHYPYLSMSQVHSALAYYWDHKAELDADMERRFQVAETLRHESSESPVVAKLRSQGLL